MEYYPLLKMFHLFGVVILMGNITVTAVWKLLADRTRSPQVVAFSQRLVTITDIAFTFVGAIVILFTGILLAEYYGGRWSVPWIRWGTALFAASGVIWVLVLIPIQIRQAQLAKAFASEGPIPPSYWVLSKWWMIFGALATILPMANLYFMVFKPV